MRDQQSRAVAATDRVPFPQKVAYGAGMLANQMFPAALGIFMVILVNDLEFPPLLWGLLFFLPRLLDAITDPIMGFITDNTKSRWGRRRPYIFLGAFITSAAYIAMWQLDESNGLSYNFTYFFAFSLIFYIGLTIFATPFVAMGYELSGDYHERTRLMAVAQWIGQWAWVIVPWFWPLLYNPNLFESAAEGARTLSIWVAVACLILALIPAVFVRSRKEVDPSSLRDLSIRNISGNLSGFFIGFGTVFRNAPFRRLCLATLLIYSSFQTVAAFSFFIIVYHLFDGDAGAAGNWPAWFGTISALSTCFLVIPIVTFLAQRFGKKTTFIMTQALSLVGYAMFWWTFQPDNPYMMLLPIPIYAFGIGGLFTLMTSMTADVCDLDELNTGSRREGTFGAIYWWMVKFGLALAGGLSGIIMHSAGFTPNAEIQPEGAMTGMRLAFSLVPIAGTVLAILIMLGYDMSEKRTKEIQAELQRRRGETTAGA